MHELNIYSGVNTERLAETSPAVSQGPNNPKLHGAKRVQQNQGLLLGIFAVIILHLGSILGPSSVLRLLGSSLA